MRSSVVPFPDRFREFLVVKQRNNQSTYLHFFEMIRSAIPKESVLSKRIRYGYAPCTMIPLYSDLTSNISPMSQYSLWWAVLWNVDIGLSRNFMLPIKKGDSLRSLGEINISMWLQSTISRTNLKCRKNCNYRVPFEKGS